MTKCIVPYGMDEGPQSVKERRPFDSIAVVEMASPAVTAICQQIHPPTGVTHCASAYFTCCPTSDGGANRLPNLILVRATQLEVHYVSVELKLELVERFPLYGEVESMAVLKSRAKRGQRDAVVLAFRDAKLSVIEWDDFADTIRTSSLHCFENDPALKGGHEVFPYAPRVAADPQGRCICCLIYHNQLAVLPAMDVDHLESEKNLSKGASVGNSYVLNLEKLGIIEVRDYVFLHGYNEPVILILHEPNPTWPARLRERKDTCWLTAVSLNFQEKIYPVIWSAKGLPSDAYKLVPVPTRGALVLCVSIIAYYSQGQHLAVGVNPFAFAGEVPQRVELDPAIETPSVTATKLAVNYANNVHPECASAISKGASRSAVFDIELDGAQYSWLDSESLILALKSGQLVSVHMKNDGTNVKGMQLSKCGSAPIASCATVVGEQLLFLGSWLGDSLMVNFVPVHSTGDSNAGSASPDSSSPPQKQPEEDPIDIETLDEAQLFGVDLAGGRSNEIDYHLRVVDVVQCIGPIRDMVAGAPPEAEGITQHTSLSPQLVACVGSGRGGALAVMRRGVVAEVLIEVPVPDVEGVWALHYRGEDEIAPLVSSDNLTHSFLVIASSSDTMVLESGEELEEVTKRSDFITTETTIFAGSLFSHTRILQVCRSGIWLFKGTQVWQHISAETLSRETESTKDPVEAPQSDIAASSNPVEDSGNELANEVAQGGDSAGQSTQEDNEKSANMETDVDLKISMDESLDDVSSESSIPPLHEDNVASQNPKEEEGLDERAGQSDEEAPEERKPTNPKDSPSLNAELGGIGEPTEGKDLPDQIDVPDIEMAENEEKHVSDKPINLDSENNADWDDFNVVLEPESDLNPVGPVPEQPMENMPIDVGGEIPPPAARIKSASISDPLMLILLDNGEAVLLEGDCESRTLHPMETAKFALMQLPRENPLAEIVSCALYLDVSLWLNEGAPSALFPAPIFCIVCRRGGSMEIYDLPQMECIYSCRCFSLGWPVLSNDSNEGGWADVRLEAELEEPMPSIAEVRMEAFMPPYPESVEDVASGICVCGRPTLLAVLDDGSVVVYRAFRPPGQQVAFKRVELEYMGDGGVGTLDAGGSIPPERYRMVRFNGIGEDSPCSGVFISGVTPLWLVVSENGIIVHRLLVDGAVTSMTPFSNVNCPQGFILAMTSRQLKICSLHKERLDCPWPCHKVALRCTPNKIAWYPDARLYSVLCSRPIAFRERMREEEGGDTHSAAAYAVAEQAAKSKGYEEGHEVRLMMPGSWTTPWLLPLEPNECGLSVRAVHLKDQSDGTVHPLVAVGTAFTIGEDYPSTGRCLLLRILKEQEVIGSNGGVEESWSGDVACSHEVRGPVSALAVLDGCLLMASGNRLELCAWNGRGLMRMAFFDGPVYITSVNVVKSFVLFGDLHKGIHFVWYTYPTSGHDTSPDAREIVLLGKDFNHSDVHATEFLVNGTNLSFLFADGGKNVHIQSYHRDHPDSWNGRRLLSDGGCHIGHHVGRMIRMRLCCPDGVNRQAAVYGTMDGGLGYVAPMWDQGLFERLINLQQLLVRNVVHHAGLNPVAFRMRHRRTPKALGGGSQHGKPPPRNRILDGDLLCSFWFLDRIKQQNLARTVGTSRQQIVEDLQGISLATSFF